MDKESVVKTLERFRNSLEARGIRLSKLVLYGSYARGNPTATSDIDVVVISDDFTGMGYWERIDILTEAIYEVFAPVEAVAMTTAEWESNDFFICDYARDGEILFAA
jgi:predicted nucleotidyltransferase